jgi:hypothetical protein
VALSPTNSDQAPMQVTDTDLSSAHPPRRSFPCCGQPIPKNHLTQKKWRILNSKIRYGGYVVGSLFPKTLTSNPERVPRHYVGGTSGLTQAFGGLQSHVCMARNEKGSEPLHKIMLLVSAFQTLKSKAPRIDDLVEYSPQALECDWNRFCS